LKLTCIDPYQVYHTRRSQDEQDAIFAEATKLLTPYGVNIIRERSQDVADRFEDASLDFVNIDGDHTFDAAVMDIVMYVPKVREGGMILIHDYCAFRLSGVMQAVDAYTHCHRIEPWFVTKEHEPTVFWQRGAERC
jgi:predicted O-methyltransferase YrrM